MLDDPDSERLWSGRIKGRLLIGPGGWPSGNRNVLNPPVWIPKFNINKKIHLKFLNSKTQTKPNPGILYNLGDHVIMRLTYVKAGGSVKAHGKVITWCERDLQTPGRWFAVKYQPNSQTLLVLAYVYKFLVATFSQHPTIWSRS